MRDLVLGIVIPLAFIWALFSAPGSILVLNWIWFQRPYDFSWGVWNTLPLFKIAILLAIFSNFMRGNLRPQFPPLLLVYLLFLGWITLSAANAFDTELAWKTYRAYMPSMWIAPILLFATIHDLKLLRWVLWVAAGGIGINGFKTGAVLTASGGGHLHLTNQISGFVGDNNLFGLVLCLVVAILMGLRHTLPKRWWIPVLFYVFIAIIVVSIIFTKSRGALLTLGIILLLASMLSGRAIRSLLVLGMVVFVGYVAVPPEYFDRLGTLRDVSADGSAVGRFQNWGLAWDAAVAHPLFGVGPENHIPYHDAQGAGVQTRVAHSIYFQILGELGFPGLGLYLLFFLMGLGTLFRTWRAMIPLAERHPDMAWVRDTAFWMFCGFLGYAFGAGLLNMLWIEFPWYAMFYGSMLLPLALRQLEARDRAPAAAPAATEPTAAMARH